MRGCATVVRGLLAVSLLVLGGCGRDDRRFRYYYGDILSPFFRLDQRAGLYVAVRPGAEPASFLIQKPANGFRVFILGGSIASRYMSSAPFLQIALSKSLPSRKVEVVGCGMPGYDSFRERRLLEEILGYAPDAVILMSGQNEGIGSAPIPLWRYETLRLAQALFGWEPLAPRPRTEEELGRTFGDNLSAMIALAKARSVPLLICVPPINYRDAPPSRPLDYSDPRFLRGWLPYLRGDARTALAVWRGDDDALALFFTGRCLEKEGRPAEARKAYARALDADPLEAQGATPQRLERIRQIARSTGETAVDLDALFQKTALPRSPGLDMFTDGVHWLHRLDPLVTQALVDAMKRDPRLQGLAWTEAGAQWLTRVEVASGFFGDENLSLLRYALRGINRSERAPLWTSLVYLDALQRRIGPYFEDLPSLVRIGKQGSLAQGAEWDMPELDVLLPWLRWSLGEVAGWNGKPAQAQRDYQAALALAPSLAPVWLSRAVAAAAAKDQPSARIFLEKARSAGLAGQAAALEPVLLGPEQMAAEAVRR